MLKSQADVALNDPGTLTAALLDHLAAHDVAFETRGRRTFADLGGGVCVLEPRDVTLRVSVEAPDQGVLEMLRATVASAIIEFSGEETLPIAWRGHVAEADTFANFREVRLESIVDLTPRMRRMRLTGEDLDRFRSDDDIHVRFYIPPEGVARPEWPRPGPDGRTLWPAEGLRPAVRYYTIRYADGRSVEIDVVIHDDAGPGSTFALEARPGAICGIAGPLGRTALPAAWTLLAGDETALPAIARLLETMPPEARGTALIEVADARDIIDLAAPAGVELRWLERRAAPAGDGRLLLDAIRGLDWPTTEGMFVWAGCEVGEARELRAHVRGERGLARDQQLIVGYWERGQATRS